MSDTIAPAVPPPTEADLALDLTTLYHQTWRYVGIDVSLAELLTRRAAFAEDKAAAGERFKAFVHSYLDAHGVPHGDPDNHHQKEGCRIGARLDLMFAERDAEQAKREEQEGQLVDICQVFGKDARGFGTVAKMVESEVARLRAIIKQHDLCHDLHGKVGPREFADGCTAEQRKLYGCAPDSDELVRLWAAIAAQPLSVQDDITDEMARLEAENNRF